MKATMKLIQAHINEKHPQKEITFYKGKGYFYFEDACGEIESIMVYALNHCDLAWWIDCVDYHINQAHEEGEQS